MSLIVNKRKCLEEIGIYSAGGNVLIEMNLNEKENNMENMLVDIVKDLENSRHKYGGYPYVRTIRNILVGKSDAAIAPYFNTKPYYGMFYELTLKETEDLLDELVGKNKLDTIFTGHGKMYCSVEEYYF